MIDPKIKTKVVHSKTKDVWNVVTGDKIITGREKKEAKIHAEFISACFNNSGLVMPFIR